MTADPIFASNSLEEQMTFPSEDITPEHWRWVRGLLTDVDRQDQCENLLSIWGQWQLVVRQFRQAEFSSMRRKDPKPVDIQWHEIIVTGLISLGQRILKQVALAGESDEFHRHGFRLSAAEVQLNVLRQNWEEWHGTIDVSRFTVICDRLSSLNAAEPFNRATPSSVV